jgi:cyclohexadienyl dehydratase
MKKQKLKNITVILLLIVTGLIVYKEYNDPFNRIKRNKVIRVGMTGDYLPMSYLNLNTGEYEGFDVELVETLADDLGVQIQYVATTWPTLMEDTLNNKFDIAICGITITENRKEKALMSESYLGNGKTMLIRAEDIDKYKTLDDINKKEVVVMENPGGTNERFVRENLPDVTLIIHENNAEIPGLIAQGEADVMITEILEAGYYIQMDNRLAAPLINEPFTREQIGIMMPKGYERLLNYVNQFIEKEKTSGMIDMLANKYIYH